MSLDKYLNEQHNFWSSRFGERKGTIFEKMPLPGQDVDFCGFWNNKIVWIEQKVYLPDVNTAINNKQISDGEKKIFDRITGEAIFIIAYVDKYHPRYETYYELGDSYVGAYCFPGSDWFKPTFEEIKLNKFLCAWLYKEELEKNYWGLFK